MTMGYLAMDVRAIRPRKTIVKRSLATSARVQHLQGFRESPPSSAPDALCGLHVGDLPKLHVDAEGFMTASVGKIDDRYVVSQELGRGTFGSVLKAWDSSTGRSVAIKVVKNGQKSTQDALIEAAKLSILNQSEVGRRYVVIAHTEFFFMDHFCIVFELLGLSMHKALDRLRCQGKQISLESLRNVSKQLCEGVQFLTQCGLVHADLKPENVVLYPESDLEDSFPLIKLIDFGCAAWEGGPPGSVVQTCYYRAPEVTLGLSWSYPCDMWSVGCIVLELLEMRRTFDTLLTAQHLAMMERVCGPMPKHMLKEAASLTTAQHLIDRRSHRLCWPETSGGSKGARRSPVREQQVAATLPLALRLAQPRLLPLHSFLQGLFRLDPAERSSPMAALSSDWLQSTCPTPVQSHRSLPSACATPVPLSHHLAETPLHPPPHRPVPPAMPSDVAAHKLAAPLAALWAPRKQEEFARALSGCGSDGRQSARNLALIGDHLQGGQPLPRCASFGVSATSITQGLPAALQTVGGIERTPSAVIAEAWRAVMGGTWDGVTDAPSRLPSAGELELVPPLTPPKLLGRCAGERGGAPLVAGGAQGGALAMPQHMRSLVMPSGVLAGPWVVRS